MTDLSAPSPRPGAGNGWLLRAAGSRRFQTWAMRVPGLKRLVAREGAAMFDLVAGFCQSQVLMALVDLGTMERLSRGPQTAADLAQAAGVPPERMLVLLRAGAAAGLLRVGRTVRLTLRGGALLAVPGLAELIRHHKVLYRDLADPAAFFRGETRTELAELWPYVLGAGAAADPAILSGGIWEALLTTAAGLAIAVPAVIAVQVLDRIVDRVRHALGDAATRVFTLEGRRSGTMAAEPTTSAAKEVDRAA